MMASVQSLEDRCLDFLFDRQTFLATLLADSQDDAACGDSNSPMLPGNIVEKLLYKLSQKKKLTDRMLRSILGPERTELQSVQIPDASRITVKGLEIILKSRSLKSLNVRRCSRMSLADILSCMGSETFIRLQCFSCERTLDRNGSCPFSSLDKYTVNIFRKFVNVRDLTLINMKLSDVSLRVIAESLPHLVNLNISENEDICDISPLSALQSLETLTMRELTRLASQSTTHTLQHLRNLERLDVSLRRRYRPLVDHVWDAGNPLYPAAVPYAVHLRCIMADLLANPSSNPDLISLDMSGRGETSEERLRAYVAEHPSLRFLGLWGSEACHFSILGQPRSPSYLPLIVVAGSSNLEQYAATMDRYHCRDPYVAAFLGFSLQDDPKELLATPSSDNIIKSLLRTIPPYSLWSSDQCRQTADSLWCLSFLLTYRPVSTNIEPDTFCWLLRVCRRLAQTSNVYTSHNGDIHHLANRIVEVCERRNSSSTANAQPPP